MPFIFQFIQNIKHESAREALTRAQSCVRVSLPWSHMETCIVAHQRRQNVAEDEQGFHMGHNVVIVGLSGSGKSWALKRIATHALQQTHSRVLYLDLDDRFQGDIDNTRFHLLQPTHQQLLVTMAGLETWFRNHDDTSIRWVLVDGCTDNTILHALQQLQQRWGFVSIIASRSLSPPPTLHDYRFEVYKEDTHIWMKPWPSVTPPFKIA
ncbi:uncharacterized protein BYT42DRAFT_613609 [Radiomyces spectabilis]|uniref:uncharacterized protein n=1 Tax=Radiomyces spectabilis TaxID=64574 RepID=UPI0022202DE8|nr:uncharacterized protein BYT42DRAFT_613609 [Radiomyces spectabilis]KAI8379285.1 hypothetical protein BYT42DRAFT_613609 [Radiomyces spectabilis]